MVAQTLSCAWLWLCVCGGGGGSSGSIMQRACSGPTHGHASKLMGAHMSSSTHANPAYVCCVATAQPLDALGSSPLSGMRVGLVAQTLGEGVQAEVEEAVRGAAAHMASLGATVEEVRRACSLRVACCYMLHTRCTLLHRRVSLR